MNGASKKPQNFMDCILFLFLDETAINSIIQHLVVKAHNHTYIAMTKSFSKELDYKMEHLVKYLFNNFETCFVPGMLTLGSSHLKWRKHDLELAKEIARTCYTFYNSTLTKLGPESISFFPSRQVQPFWVEDNPNHLIRPGTCKNDFRNN